MVDLGYMYSVLHTALTSLFLSTSISNVTTPWEGCERCATILVSRAVVMSWYAPASDCDTALYESVVGEIRCREARGMGAERFLLVGDFNLEL